MTNRCAVDKAEERRCERVLPSLERSSRGRCARVPAGAAWSMTQMTSSAHKVALVQTALMLPVALLSTVAGAIADMFDRRAVGLFALSIALTGSVCLTLLA